MGQLTTGHTYALRDEFLAFDNLPPEVRERLRYADSDYASIQAQDYLREGVSIDRLLAALPLEPAYRQRS